MHALRIIVGIGWVAFWGYWLVSAAGAKRGVGGRRRLPITGVAAVALVLLVRLLHGRSLTVHSPVLAGVGTGLFVAGLVLALWARHHMGSNWGMPMTEKVEPELVTTGPYSVIRHPIYTGIVLAVIGTALLTSLIGLAVGAVVAGYFLYCARVEERNLATEFSAQYEQYRAATKMLIPFVL